MRRPLAHDVVEQDGEVVLARDADTSDPVLPLRVAEAAARAGLPLPPATLEGLRGCPDLPLPWPAPARDAFVGLLAGGPAAVPVLEALDQAGLLVRLLPEWERVRSKPQRNSYHRFTVDRHLVEAAAAAAALTRRVTRPDLLLLGALLHDLGKGWPGDHTDVGVRGRRPARPAARPAARRRRRAGRDGPPPPAAARRRHAARPGGPRDGPGGRRRPWAACRCSTCCTR